MLVGTYAFDGVAWPGTLYSDLAWTGTEMIGFGLVVKAAEGGLNW